jgi:large subunit ribosomal protein L20
MPRVKGGTVTHARHKKVINAAKGYYGRRKNTFKVATQAVDKANQYATRDRKNRKRNFRALWIQRINAAVRAHDEALTYSRFINGLTSPASRWTARCSPISPCTSPTPSAPSWNKPNTRGVGAAEPDGRCHRPLASGRAFRFDLITWAMDRAGLDALVGSDASAGTRDLFPVHAGA